MIAAAETRLERARLELRKHVEEGARQLLIELAPECRAAVAAFVEWAQQGQEHLTRLHHLRARATSICVESRAFDVREIPDVDHWVQAVKVISTGAPAPPLPTSLLADLDGTGDE